MIYQFKAYGSQLYLDSINEGTTGNVNSYECRILYESDDWNGRECFAVFKVGADYYTQILTDGCCIIPDKALEKAQAIYMGIYGIRFAEQTDRLSTNWVVVNIGEGAYSEGTAPEVPSPDIWEQYMAEMRALIPSKMSQLENDGDFVSDAQYVHTDNNYTNAEKGKVGNLPEDTVSVLANKVDKAPGKGLSTNDYTDAEQAKLAGIESGAQVNAVASVAGRTGAVVLAKADVGLAQVDNTSDAAKPVSTAVQAALEQKADKAEVDAAVSALESRMAALIRPRLYAQNQYLDTDGALHPLNGAMLYVLDGVVGGGILLGTTTDGTPPLPAGLNRKLWFMAELEDGSFEAVNSIGGIYYQSSIDTVAVILPHDVRRLYFLEMSGKMLRFTTATEFLNLRCSAETDRLLDVCCGQPFNVFDVYPKCNFYFKSTKAISFNTEKTYLWAPMKAGDAIKIETLSVGTLKFNFSVVTLAYDRETGLQNCGTIVTHTGTRFTAEEDCIVILNSMDDAPQCVYYIPKGTEGTDYRTRGKRFTSFGDSITYQEMWQGHLAEKYGLIHTNCGVGSSRVAGSQDSAFHKDARLNAVIESNPDIVTILGGANDLVAGYDIGTEEEFEKALESKNKSTFLGAYSYVVEKLLAWKPTLRIVILGTTWAHNDGKDYSQTLTYTDFSNACRTLAAYYGLPFVDLHGECGFNKYTMTAEHPVYSSDHIHPNEAGGKRIAEVVDKAFKTLFAFGA